MFAPDPWVAWQEARSRGRDPTLPARPSTFPKSLMNADRWTELKKLFAEALALEGAARDAFVAEVEARTPGLGTELADLLAADEETENLLDGDPGALFGSDWAAADGEWASDSDTDGEGDSRIGSRIGAWSVAARLGAGGMGVVYRAERADGAFDQSVALKVLRRGMDTESILARFRAERQILAGLEHPNIARLVDGGMTDDGLPWFSMEYVAGTHLTRFCDTRRLPVDERLSLFETVCSAVQHAQERLVVHRDLKPSNVLVTDDGEVKLLDFGIARVLSDGGSGQTTVAGGPRALTVAYAAPEQITGGTITTATDVYSLGTILYELLTGIRPRDSGPDGIVKRPSELVTHTEETVSAARAAQPDRLRRRLAGDLDNICLKALREDPARRYATAGELLEDLRRHREGRPVTARPDTFGYRASRFISRNRTAVFGAAAALLLVLMTAAGYTVRLAEERDRAQAAATEAEEVTDFLVGLFEMSDPSESLGRAITARDLLESGAARVDTELSGQPDVQASLYSTIGLVNRNLGLYEDARPLLTRALEMRQAALGSDHPEVAESLAELAWLELRTDGYARADSLQRLAVEMWERLEGESSEEYASALVALGGIALEEGRLQEADTILNGALALQNELFEGDHVDIAETLHSIGAVHFYLRDYEPAEEYFRESLEMRRRLHDPMHPGVIRAYDDWGDALANTGRADEAEEVAREVLEMREALYGPDHPEVAHTLHNLGATLQFQRRYDEAISVFEEALRRYEASVGLMHTGPAGVYGNLGRTYRLLGRLEEAEVAARTSLEIRDSLFGPDSQRNLQGISILANTHADLGRFEEALAGYARIQAILDANGEYDPTNYSNIALTYQDMGDTLAVLETHRRSVVAAREAYADDALGPISAMIAQGRAQAWAGRWDEAAETFRGVYEVRQRELPDDSWFVFSSLSLYGWALMGTQQWRDAEEALLGAWEGLRAADPTGYESAIALRTQEAAQRLAHFYDIAGDAEEQARWQAELDRLMAEAGG